MAQKTRKKVEAKAKKEAEKRRIAEKKKKKKRTLEYLQQLQNKMLAEDATFLESTKRFQIVGSKYKKILPENNRDRQPFKKAKRK